MLHSLFSLAATGSFCWLVTSSLWIYPHSLSYFNESIGGPLNGPKHLLGSNVDWGQDLRYLREREINGDFDNVALFMAYFGYVSPADLGFNKTLQLNDISIRKQRMPGHSSCAISVTLFYNRQYEARDGWRGKYEIEEEVWRKLRAQKKGTLLAYSMYLINMTSLNLFTDN